MEMRRNGGNLVGEAARQAHRQDRASLLGEARCSWRVRGEQSLWKLPGSRHPALPYPALWGRGAGSREHGCRFKSCSMRHESHASTRGRPF